MAISEAYASSQAVDTTEWSCPNDAAYNSANVITTDGVYQFFLDVTDMTAGDILSIKLYEKVQSAGAVAVIFESVLKNAQAEKVWVSPSFILLHGWDLTLDALAGTITVEWSIRKVA
jgi:hypothetical protein